MFLVIFTDVILRVLAPFVGMFRGKDDTGAMVSRESQCVPSDDF